MRFRQLLKEFFCFRKITVGVRNTALAVNAGTKFLIMQIHSINKQSRMFISACIHSG